VSSTSAARDQKSIIGVVVLSLQLSGGVSIILEYLKILAMSNHVFLIVPRSSITNSDPTILATLGDQGLNILVLEETRINFDLIILSFWKTVFLALESQLKAREWLYFVQSLEDRFNANPDDFHPIPTYSAQATYCLDLPILTEATWIHKVLKRRNFNSEIYLIKNPILIGTDPLIVPIESREIAGIVNVVIEGDETWFKSASETIAAVSEVKIGQFKVHLVGCQLKPEDTDHVQFISHGRISRSNFHSILKNSHLLVKMSIVEGMYGPPLEGFYFGTPCLTSNVTGCEEYIKHNVNAIVVESGDFVGLTRWLEYFYNNPAILTHLSEGALQTSRTWQTINTNQLAPILISSLAVSTSPPLVLKDYCLNYSKYDSEYQKDLAFTNLPKGVENQIQKFARKHHKVGAAASLISQLKFRELLKKIWKEVRD